MKTSYGTSENLEFTNVSGYSVSMTDSDDNLGAFQVQYINQVVTDTTWNTVKLKTYNTGNVEVIILPRHAN